MGIIFWVELTWKVVTHGFCAHFCGDSRVGNIFDACLVFLDTMQIVIHFSLAAEEPLGIDVALFRLLKIFRVARLLHLIQYNGLEDFVAMCLGVIHGTQTLIWAMILFS